MFLKRIFFTFLFCFCPFSFGDTFTNKKTHQQFDGYAVKTKGTKLSIRNAASEGIRTIEPADYNIVYNAKGRRQQVYVIDINHPLELECETKAFENAIKVAENQGDIAIAIKIDTPGGRVDLMKRYCTAIESVDITPVIAIVGGGQNGGAYSAGAIIAMSCDTLLMQKNSAIGAATLIVQSAEDGLKSAKSQFGQDIGEKFDSAHRAYCASVAEKAGRSGLIAEAMIDRQFEVLAKKGENGKYQFFDGRDINDKDDYKVVNHKGSLLTLTAQQASDIGFADGQIENFQQWMQTGSFAKNKFLISRDMATARHQYSIAEKKFNFALNEIEGLKTKVKFAQTNFEMKTYLSKALSQYKMIVSLKKQFEDLPVDLNDAIAATNKIEVLYNQTPSNN